MCILKKLRQLPLFRELSAPYSIESSDRRLCVPPGRPFNVCGAVRVLGGGGEVSASKTALFSQTGVLINLNFLR